MLQLRKPASKSDWAALLLGAACVCAGGYQLARGLASPYWPTAPGTVDYSTPWNQFRAYRVDIRYHYVYGGQEYRGDRYRFHFILNRMKSWEVDSAQTRYPVGEPVTVSVNPWDAADSVLVAGVDAELLLWPAFGALVMLAGVGRRRVKQKEQAAAATVPARRSRTAMVLTVIGCLVLAWGLTTVYTGVTSLTWPTTEGRILNSSVRKTTSTGYSTLLWYEYRVENTRYVGSEYRVGGNATPFHQVALAASQRYPAGRQVRVHYNAANPAEAVLEAGLWYGNCIIPGVGLVILLAAWVAHKVTVAMARRGNPNVPPVS